MPQIRGDIMPTQSNRQNIEELRNSGLYPIVDLEIFDTVKALEIFEFTLEREQEIIELYQQYIENILEMKKTNQEKYLKGIKTQEIIDNHLLEKEDPYLVTLYLEANKKTAIDYLIKQQRVPLEYLNKEEIITAHQKLLQLTSCNDYANKEHRTDNEAFVGKRKNGELEIRYFPISHEKIEEAIMNLTLYYNSDIHQNHTLIKPIILHGLTGALQIFDDGNTRFGRMVQNVKIYELTGLNMKMYLSNPALYCSKSYYDFREQYRKKIGEIAIDANNDSWDSWINFNLNRIEEQIYYANNKLADYKKIIK